MKKTVRILSLALAVLMLAATALTLASCGSKLSGTYKTDAVFGSYVSYTFKGDKVTFETVVAGVTAATIEGTYKIDGDKITLTWGDEKNDKALSGEMDYKKTDDGIKIGVLELKKEK